MLRSHRESGRRCSVSTQTKHTEGEWIVVREARQAVRVRTKYRLFSGAVRGVEICRLADVVGKNGNANLIAEAGTVAHETGLSPRQLAEQRKELLDALDTLTLVIGLTPIRGNKTALQEAFDVARAAIARAQGGAV